MPQAPEFWAKPGLLSDLLLPLAWGHAGLSAARRALAQPKHVSVPVLCVGNLVAGGAGKTPVVLSLAAMLRAAGHRPQILSRGYGGTLAGPVRVDPARHSAAEVGDEPLLLARAAPVWIGRDRAASADAAIAAGADLLLLDDGFQNPTLHQDLALVVVDGAYGLGNGRVIPAGPLREPAKTGLARAQAVVLMGATDTRFDFGRAPMLRAKLVPQAADHLKGKKLVAFAGIGRPQKFFATLTELGAIIVAQHAFPDHHRYQDTELDKLQREAAGSGATLITTEKDLVRLEPRWRASIAALKVDVAWADREAVEALLARWLGDRAHA
jgi:tetraacyldisaccharide 4'-kinase